MRAPSETIEKSAQPERCARRPGHTPPPLGVEGNSGLSITPGGASRKPARLTSSTLCALAWSAAARCCEARQARQAGRQTDRQTHERLHMHPDRPQIGTLSCQGSTTTAAEWPAVWCGGTGRVQPHAGRGATGVRLNLHHSHTGVANRREQGLVFSPTPSGEPRALETALQHLAHRAEGSWR